MPQESVHANMTEEDIIKYVKELEDKYEKKSPPKADEMSFILHRAKGRKTMAEFAKLCNTSPATFSRIRTGIYNKPMSLEMIARIVANSEEQYRRTEVKLMNANGYYLRNTDVTEDQSSEDQGMIRSNMMNARRAETEAIKTAFTGYILSFLFKKGYTMTMLPEWKEDNDKYNLTLISDMRIKLNNKNDDNCQEMLIWLYDIAEISGEYKEYDIQKKVTCFVDRHCKLFLRDRLDPVSMSNMLNVIVFRNEDVFNGVVDFVKDVRVNSDMTLLLIENFDQQINLVRPYKIPRADNVEHGTLLDDTTTYSD